MRKHTTARKIVALIASQHRADLHRSIKLSLFKKCSLIKEQMAYKRRLIRDAHKKNDQLYFNTKQLLGAQDDTS
jgi:hypothetical protein